MASESDDEQIRIATGVPGLDAVLSGGLPADHVYLVSGSPGTGKTTLGLQFLVEGARRGESCLYVTLSENARELDAIARSHGWSLDGITVNELTPPEESLKPEEQYTIFYPAELELGETVRALVELVERMKPQRVVVDSLSEMRLVAREPLRFRRQIFALKQFFVGRQCTVILLDEQSTGADEHPQTIAHGVITLEQIARDYGAERRRLRVIKLRGTAFRGGYHDFSIRTGGLVVYPRLVAKERRDAIGGQVFTSGIAALDALVGGGLDAGTCTAVIGPAGAGKSILATQYAVTAARAGTPVGLYVFDETVAMVRKRTASIGMALDELIADGTVQIRHIDPAELTPGEFMYEIQEGIERDRQRVVVIDSLTGYQNAMPNENLLGLYMHELITHLNLRGVLTFVVVAQHGILGSQMESPIDLSYLADTVLLLRYFEAAGSVRQAISVVKKRSGEHERAIREFKIDRGGIRVGDPLVQFQGILTGTPLYLGKAAPLLIDD